MAPADPVHRNFSDWPSSTFRVLGILIFNYTAIVKLLSNQQSYPFGFISNFHTNNPFTVLIKGNNRIQRNLILGSSGA